MVARTMLYRMVIVGSLFQLGSAFGQQGIVDSIFVELYHVMDSPVVGEPPLKTYRIFVDLAPGYKLQTVFGDERNQLYITTTTRFFNDAENSVKYADQLNEERLNTGMAALDSWLTIGAASSAHWGVPRPWDTDGSLLECPPYPSYVPPSTDHGKRRKKEKTLCELDGMLKAGPVPAVVNFKFDPGYLGQIRGAHLHTMDGAWAVLGGTLGPTEENVLLIAQLTTTGDLSYKLNIQVGLPDGSFMRYVHTDAHGDEEAVLKGLIRGTSR